MTNIGQQPVPPKLVPPKLAPPELQGAYDKIDRELLRGKTAPHKVKNVGELRKMFERKDMILEKTTTRRQSAGYSKKKTTLGNKNNEENDSEMIRCDPVTTVTNNSEDDKVSADTEKLSSSLASLAENSRKKPLIWNFTFAEI